MTFRNGYDIAEAVRKVASATAFRALFLENPDGPNHREKKIGLAIAVALYYNLNEAELEEFIAELRNYVQVRKEESIFRNPEVYE